jgi:hypothetical protein
MSSLKRIEANRRNALLSTGPRTADGKAIVARNAVRHGLRAQHVLIAGESLEEFDRLHEAMIAEQVPVGVLEHELVEKIVVSLWRLKRARRIEVEIIEHLSEAPEQAGAGQIPFKVIIRKTYEGGRIETEEPLARLPEEETADRADAELAEPKRRTLGEAVKAGLEGAGVLGKFVRYEAHIARMLFASIRELERIQERRRRRGDEETRRRGVE